MRGRKVQCPNSKCQSTVLIPSTDASSGTAADHGGRFIQSTGESNADLSDSPLPATDPNYTGLIFSKPLVVAGIAILFVLITATGSLLMLGNRNAADPFSDLVSKTVPLDLPPAQAEEEAAHAREQVQKDSRDQKERERQEQLAAEEAMKKKGSDSKLAEAKLAAQQEAERIRQEAMDAQAKAAREAASNEDGPFSFIKADLRCHDRHGQWLFELPPPGADVSSEPLPLRTHGEDVKLSLCEAAVPLFAACPFQLELQRSPSNTEKWLVVASREGTQVELGEYTLKALGSAEPDAPMPDHQLSFRWRREAAREISAAELLRWWPLQISVGDRSAVLLQRSTYLSEVPLKWESLVNCQKTVFPRSSELQAIELTPNSLLSFCLEIQQANVPPQSLCLDLVDGDVEPENQELVETAAACSKSFSLTLPLKFQETVLDVLESPLGFGTLKLQVSRTPEDGLVVQPKLELVLRLPGKEHLESFPDAAVLAEFTAITKDPERIRNLPSSDGIRNVATQMTQRTRDDPTFWHKQPLRAMGRKASFEPAFMNRAQGSIKFLKQFIRKAEGDVNLARIAVAQQERQMAPLIARRNLGDGAGVARMLDLFENGLAQQRQRLSQAETRLGIVRQFTPDIEQYCLDLSELIVEFTRQHESLIQDYDAIDVQLDELLNASKAGYFKVRGEMMTTIQTPQAENGPSIRIYFVEASSQGP